MQYKTIVLELLEQCPEMYDQLRSKRMLLPTLNFYAGELKASHEAWKIRLSQDRPGSNESQMGQQYAATLEGPPVLADQTSLQTGVSGLGLASFQQEHRPAGLRTPTKCIGLVVGFEGCFVVTDGGLDITQNPVRVADRPWDLVAQSRQRVLNSDYLVEELVRDADVEWGRVMGERPHFEKAGSPHDPDDPYTVESVRNALSGLLEQLAAGEG